MAIQTLGGGGTLTVSANTTTGGVAALGTTPADSDYIYKVSVIVSHNAKNAIGFMQPDLGETVGLSFSSTIVDISGISIGGAKEQTEIIYMPNSISSIQTSSSTDITAQGIPGTRTVVFTNIPRTFTVGLTMGPNTQINIPYTNSTQSVVSLIFAYTYIGYKIT